MIGFAAALFASAASQAAAPPCRWEEDGIHRYGPPRDCQAWLAPRRFSGVWINQFEGSLFVEDARTLEEALRLSRAARSEVWLSRDTQSLLPPGCSPLIGEAFWIDFVGCEAVARHDRPPGVVGGGFGHLGMSSREILIDRARTIHTLGSLPGTQVSGVSRQQPCV